MHIKAEKEKKIIQPTCAARERKRPLPANQEGEKFSQPLLCKIKEFGIIFHMRARPFGAKQFFKCCKGAQRDAEREARISTLALLQCAAI